MKQIIIRQYQRLVDKTAEKVTDISTPPEGWLRTVRRSLGMSGAQLAKRLNVSRAQITQAEKAELTGGITLKTLNSMAEAMNCHLVYTIVPKKTINELIAEQANKKADQLVQQLEQTDPDFPLNPEQRDYEIQRLQRELIKKMPRSLWGDD